MEGKPPQGVIILLYSISVEILSSFCVDENVLKNHGISKGYQTRHLSILDPLSWIKRNMNNSRIKTQMKSRTKHISMNKPTTEKPTIKITQKIWILK